MQCKLNLGFSLRRVTPPKLFFNGWRKPPHNGLVSLTWSSTPLTRMVFCLPVVEWPMIASLHISALAPKFFAGFFLSHMSVFALIFSCLFILIILFLFYALFVFVLQGVDLLARHSVNSCGCSVCQQWNNQSMHQLWILLFPGMELPFSASAPEFFFLPGVILRINASALFFSAREWSCLSMRQLRSFFLLFAFSLSFCFSVRVWVWFEFSPKLII